MPYGLPGAIKLAKGLLVERWDERSPKVSLRAGAIIQPLFPGAGLDGLWKCRTVDGIDVAIPEQELKESL